MIYQYGDASYSVNLEPLADGTYRVTLGDRVIVVAAQAFEGGWLITLDGRQVRVYSAARGSERWLSVEGETYTLTVPETRRRTSGSGSGDLGAQMPGQVREVFVQAGDSVKRGQALLLLEAMKMEIRVTAPADGRVKQVLVTAGAVVDRGQRLVEIEQNTEQDMKQETE